MHSAPYTIKTNVLVSRTLRSLRLCGLISSPSSTRPSPQP